MFKSMFLEAILVFLDLSKAHYGNLDFKKNDVYAVHLNWNVRIF